MKNKKLVTLTITTAVALALVILIPLKAANKHQSHDNTAALIEIIKIYKLVHELELSTKQLITFYPKYNKLQGLKRKYTIENRKAIKEFKELDAKENASEKECEDALNKYREIEQSIVQDMLNLRDELESQLSPKQKIKLMLFDYSYRRTVEKILKRVKELKEKS